MKKQSLTVFLPSYFLFVRLMMFFLTSKIFVLQVNKDDILPWEFEYNPASFAVFVTSFSQTSVCPEVCHQGFQSLAKRK